MVQAERMQAILDILKENDFVTVDFLVKKLHYSPATVRRDLTELARLGLAEKNWGGVSLIREDTRHGLPPYPFRLQKNVRDKQAAARLAASLVKDGDTVFIDGSTTASYMAVPLLAKKDITVITNNLELLSALHRGGVATICTGGAPVKDGDVLFGYTAERAVEDRRADICFFSAHGYDKDGNITEVFDDTIRLVRRMIQNSAVSVFLCDAEKEGAPSPTRLCTFNDISCVVCERDIEAQFSRDFPNVRFLSARH